MSKITLISSITVIIIYLIITLITPFDKDNTSKNNDFHFENFNANIIIEEDPDLKTLGTHQEVGGVHFIKLKEYPICLLHEIRHATEGDWHKGRESDEDCYQH